MDFILEFFSSKSFRLAKRDKYPFAFGLILAYSLIFVVNFRRIITYVFY